MEGGEKQMTRLPLWFSSLLSFNPLETSLPRSCTETWTLSPRELRSKGVKARRPGKDCVSFHPRFRRVRLEGRQRSTEAALSLWLPQADCPGFSRGSGHGSPEPALPNAEEVVWPSSSCGLWQILLSSAKLFKTQISKSSMVVTSFNIFFQ